MAYKAGCENPASSQRSDVISNRQSRPGVQMPGDRTRKVPGPSKAGQDVAGDEKQVTITHGRKSPGKQTWKGAESGYTTRSIPDYKPSPASRTFQDTSEAQGMRPTSTGAYRGDKVKLNGDIKRGGGSAAQKVKGKKPAATGGEAKSVAGKKNIEA